MISNLWINLLLGLEEIAVTENRREFFDLDDIEQEMMPDNSQHDDQLDIKDDLLLEQIEREMDAYYEHTEEDDLMLEEIEQEMGISSDIEGKENERPEKIAAVEEETEGVEEAKEGEEIKDTEEFNEEKVAVAKTEAADELVHDDAVFEEQSGEESINFEPDYCKNCFAQNLNFIDANLAEEKTAEEEEEKEEFAHINYAVGDREGKFVPEDFSADDLTGKFYLNLEKEELEEAEFDWEDLADDYLPEELDLDVEEEDLEEPDIDWEDFADEDLPDELLDIEDEAYEEPELDWDDLEDLDLEDEEENNRDEEKLDIEEEQDLDIEDFESDLADIAHEDKDIETAELSDSVFQDESVYRSRREVRKTIKEISDMLDSIISKENDRRQEEVEYNEEERPLSLSALEMDMDYDFVSDYYRDGDWELVTDEPADKEAKEVSSKEKNKIETAATKKDKVGKKSLSLTSILLVGGGVLVLGLTTAGVISYVKQKRMRDKEIVVEALAEQETKPVKDKPNSTEQVNEQAGSFEQNNNGPMQPVTPLWPIFGYPPPPPRQGYEQVG